MNTIKVQPFFTKAELEAIIEHCNIQLTFTSEFITEKEENIIIGIIDKAMGQLDAGFYKDDE
jgi:hypothetical protein